MKKIDSEEIKINVNNANKKANNNKLVRICYLIMTLIYIANIVFFARSAIYVGTFYGGLMSCVFIAGYCLSAYLIIRRDQDATFISLLYLILIYAIPCCWMGISYAFKGQANLYDYVQFIICIGAMVCAILGIIYYYRNIYKFASIFAFVSMIISIIGLVLGGTAEIIRAAVDPYYFPFVGICFFADAALGVLPLIYLFRTV
jgi:hypothetical protein